MKTNSNRGHRIERPLVWPFVCVLLLSSPAVGQLTRSFTEPWEQIEVAAGESGILAKVNVKEGDSITKDQVLAELDTRVLQQSRRLAKRRTESTARRDAAEADVKLKQMMFDNLTPLLRDGHANVTEVELAKLELAQAVSSLRLAEDDAAESLIDLDRIDAQIQSRQIRSPIDGVVVEVYRHPGEYLPGADPRFARLARLDKLRCRFFVKTSVAESLREGDFVDVELGHQNQRVDAIVDFVSPITNADSGTVRVDVLIDNSERQHRSGVVCRLVDSEHVTREIQVDQAKRGDQPSLTTSKAQ